MRPHCQDCFYTASGSSKTLSSNGFIASMSAYHNVLYSLLNPMYYHAYIQPMGRNLKIATIDQVQKDCSLKAKRSCEIAT